jgi:hypothetical protein
MRRKDIDGQTDARDMDGASQLPILADSQPPLGRLSSRVGNTLEEAP